MKFEQLLTLFQETHRELQKRAARSMDISLVVRNWLFGWYIVEFEKGGADRAEYGSKLLKKLAERLKIKGCSERGLALYCKFYSNYSEILQTASAKSEILDKIFNGSVQEIGRTVSSQALKAMVVKPDILQALSTELASRFTLGWSHYVTLLTISNPDERRFYEIEARENSWGARELERQIASSLYERLALSRDKADIKALSQDGLVIENPTDVVKNPYVLEFLDLEEKSAYSEHEMETAIINRLEHFLLELGKGFLFDFLDAAAKCVSMAPDNRFKSMKIDTKTERLEMKKLITKFTMVMFLGIAASAYSQSREGQNTASRDYSSGRHVYESTCQFCHGVAGDGKGPAASALSPRPKDFTDPQFWKGMNNEKIAQTIRSGHGRGMPAFRFSSEDIKSVIDYMSHFKKGGGK